MYHDREILYFLQTIPGFGNQTIRRLWHAFPSGMLLMDAKEEALKGILKQDQIKAFLREREKQTPTDKMALLQQKGIRYYSIFDWQYPQRLRILPDAPLALFVRGKLPSENRMTAAMVGARYHSYYGEKHAKIFAGLLAQKEIGVISGMARGIDSISQRCVIENGGETYAVLGCGVDICYPAECRKLYEMLPQHGGIISEYIPGTTPRAGLFPMRNRIISALGDILLVMEAKEKSGTLITVDMALEQGKEIWVLPGRMDDTLSAGCNRLIGQGAGILTDITSFSGELDCMKEKYRRKDKRHILERNLKKDADFSENEKNNICDQNNGLKKEILTLLRYKPLSLESIYENINLNRQNSCSIQELSMLLMELCLEAQIHQTGGNYLIGQGA